MEKVLLCTFLFNLLLLQVQADSHLPKPPYCGKSNLAHLKGRIFNGTETSSGEFPWLVLLLKEVRLFRIIKISASACTSSLITSDWILTAAHCIHDPNVYKYPLLFSQSLKAILGEWNTSIENDPDCDENSNCAPRAIALNAKHGFVHPNYLETDELDIKYDIALIRLQSRVNFSPYIQPICLPLDALQHQSIPSYEGVKVTITGWGSYNHMDEVSTIKRKAVVSVTDQQPCEEWYGRGGIRVLDKNYQLCVGGPDGGACRGDSGGPLLLQNLNDGNTYYQIGVASLGRQECVNITRPTVYVRVDTFMEWIRETIQYNDNYCC